MNIFSPLLSNHYSAIVREKARAGEYMQLHRIHVAGVVNHPKLGVMINQTQIAEGSWAFWGCDISPGEDWRNALYVYIKQKTWIDDLQFYRILWAQSFAPKIVAPDATFGLFVHVKTNSKGHGRGYRWVKNIQELEGLALFHPLVKSLCEDALNDRVTLFNK
jgi:hypothetical protein